MEPKLNQIVGIIAPKGAGKTHLAAKLFSEMSRAAVFDLMCEPEWARVCDELVVGSPKKLSEEIASEEFRVCYRPIWYDPDTLNCPSFDWFCTLGYCRGDMTLIIDEAHLFCTSHRIPRELLTIARLGRHAQCSLLYITQSFSAVTRVLRANSNTFIFYKITDPTDLEGVTERCGVEIAERVQGLRKLEARNGEIIPGERLVWRDTAPEAVSVES